MQIRKSFKIFKQRKNSNKKGRETKKCEKRTEIK